MNTIQSFWYTTIDSTMSEAKRLIQKGEIKDLAYLVTTHQTEGKGTLGREWDSPAGCGIYMSIVHLPSEKYNLEISTIYTKAAGIACVEAIKEILDIRISIKPINDLYIKGKKLGGILVETSTLKNSFTSIITGIGINTHKTIRNLDRKNIKPVSLEEVLPKESFNKFSSKELINKIVEKTCFWYSFVFKQDTETIERTWEKYKLKI